ncbi:MAG: hypothetical protein LBD59_03860 [Prevotellaceae bacterium]|jgi:hypothetical protein|nr:hypothetical protein [Prevotellaceae bacterium]
MKTLITLIMIAVLTQCSNGVKTVAQTSFNKIIMQNIYVNELSNELLEHSNELGMDSTNKLNVFEILYFQEILKTTSISFDFKDKKYAIWVQEGCIFPVNRNISII